MNRKRMIVQVLLVAMVLVRSVWADAEKAAEIMQGARDAHEKWTDYVCVVKQEQITEGETTTQLGKLNWLAPGYVRNQMTTPGPEGEMTTLMVTDGRDVYTETKGASGPVAVFHYSIAQPKPIPGGPLPKLKQKEAHIPIQMMDQLAPMYDWAVDETMNGGMIQDMAMDVVIGTYRQGAAAEHIKAEEGKENDVALKRRLNLRRNLIESMVGSIRVWIGRNDKFVHRIEMIPPEGSDAKKLSSGPLAGVAKTKIVTTYLDVKFDQKQTPADFVYTPPAGAEIREMPSY